MHHTYSLVFKTRCIEKSINIKNMSCATTVIMGVHHNISHHIIYKVEISLGNDSVLWGILYCFKGRR
jgi:hypothetical protein